jgi:hypothetical protein
VAGAPYRGVVWSPEQSQSGRASWPTGLTLNSEESRFAVLTLGEARSSELPRVRELLPPTRLASVGYPFTACVTCHRTVHGAAGVANCPERSQSGRRTDATRLHENSFGTIIYDARTGRNAVARVDESSRALARDSRRENAAPRGVARPDPGGDPARGRSAAPNGPRTKPIRPPDDARRVLLNP